MRRNLSLFVGVLLVLGTLAGFLNFESMNSQGTDVSGVVFDGSGGPWTLAGGPYIVVGDIIVPVGQTLTIEPGVQVKFDGWYRISVNGTLIAIGSDTNRINITSNMPAPARGDWIRIRIDPSGHTEIKYTNISYADTGITLLVSSNNTITSSNFTYNKEGIGIASSSNNIISNNSFSNNWDGIVLNASSSNNTITNNTFSNNDYGIAFLSTPYNRVYHNNFIDNTVAEAYDAGSNIWNDTYPSGGNYWSDYSPMCTDNFYGAVTPQTIGTPDGICDSQYNIDANSIDYYPLKNPIGTAAVGATTGTIIGKVVDESSNPIVGGLVKLENSTGTAVNDTTTNSIGEFEFTNVTFDNYTLLVSMWGYQDNDSTTANISVATPFVDVGNVELTKISGTIEIANLKPDNQIKIGTTVVIDGWANSTQTPSGHLQNITIKLLLIDSEGNLVQQKIGTTNLTGYFSIEFPIPKILEPGSYDICTSTSFGDVSAVCVPVALKSIEKGIPWLWLIVLIIIIVVAASGIFVTLLIRKKKKPSEFELHKTDIPPPPPESPPPPPP